MSRNARGRQRAAVQPEVDSTRGENVVMGDTILGPID